MEETMGCCETPIRVCLSIRQGPRWTSSLELRNSTGWMQRRSSGDGQSSQHIQVNIEQSVCVLPRILLIIISVSSQNIEDICCKPCLTKKFMIGFTQLIRFWPVRSGNIWLMNELETRFSLKSISSVTGRVRHVAARNLLQQRSSSSRHKCRSRINRIR